jgi:signal transduction histidine kinase
VTQTADIVDRNVASADEHELQACVRDLAALATMPAWWIGRPPMAIAESLRDLLVSMLRADTVSVQLHDRFVWGSQLATARGKPISAAPVTNGGAHHGPYDPSPRSDVALRRASLSIGRNGELGRIEVSAVRPTFPERRELLLMQVAANEVSVALQHAELLIRHERAEQALRARASQQAVVAHLGLRALRESSLGTILEESVAAIRETMRADHCEIFELSADARVLLLRAADGWPAGSLGGAFAVGPDTVPGRAALTSAPIVVRELQRDARFSPRTHLQEMGVVSGVSVIIHCSRGLFGVLGVHTDQPREFTDDDVHFLQSVANVLAATVEQQRTETERERLLASTAAARAEAEQASNAKSQFLGMMSHELRTPLNAIGGYAQLIEDEIRGPITDEQRADLGRIRRSQRHLLNVIENVLGFLKLGSGRMRYDLQDVLVDDIVLASEELIRPMLEAKHLHFAHRSMGGSLMVRADRSKLQQILVNLLSNATKFTDPGGRVSVECDGMAATIQIRVADTGCGIPPDRLDTVFQPFVQVDGGRQSQGEGTGLGLSISRDFAVGMGGQLLAESQLGRGSTFTIVLPRITS